jgi:hypothetical protein
LRHRQSIPTSTKPCLLLSSRPTIIIATRTAFVIYPFPPIRFCSIMGYRGCKRLHFTVSSLCAADRWRDYPSLSCPSRGFASYQGRVRIIAGSQPVKQVIDSCSASFVSRRWFKRVDLPCCVLSTKLCRILGGVKRILNEFALGSEGNALLWIPDRRAARVVRDDDSFAARVVRDDGGLRRRGRFQYPPPQLLLPRSRHR